MSSNIVKCSWCESNAIDSHTAPKSILRAARKHLSVTNIRSLEQPNLEVQDLKKRKLLCQACDNSFSPAENYFLQHIYEQLLTGTKEFVYDQRLVRFAISLAWKRLATGLCLLPELKPELITQAELALTHWQGFLQNNHRETQPYRHHLFLTKFIDQGQVSDLIRVMLMSTFDSTIIPSSSGLFIGSTFPGCILLSIVGPSASLPDWKTTQILATGKFDDNQLLPGGLLLPWFEQNIDDYKVAAKKLSPQQRQKMKDNWPMPFIGTP